VIKADDILDGKGEEQLGAGELHAKDMVFEVKG
jgi:hypothetical protein